MNVQVPTRGGVTNVAYDELPDHCPVCLNGIQPLDLNTRFHSDELIESILRCPRHDCEHSFIARYSVWRSPVGAMEGPLRGCVPPTMRTPQHEATIIAISPDLLALSKPAEAAQPRNPHLARG